MVGVKSSTVGPDKVDFTLAKKISVEAPMQNLSQVIAPVGSTVILLDTKNSESYAFFRNVDAANSIFIKDNAGNVLAMLRAREFALIPIIDSIGIEAEADTGECVLEYAFWAKAKV